MLFASFWCQHWPQGLVFKRNMRWHDNMYYTIYIYIIYVYLLYIYIFDNSNNHKAYQVQSNSLKILWGVLRNFIPHWHVLGEVAAHGRRYVCTIGEQVADGNQRENPDVMIAVNGRSLDHTIQMILLMVQKSGVHQLRLVVYPIISPLFTRVLYIPGGFLAGFLNHQQYGCVAELRICNECKLASW